MRFRACVALLGVSACATSAPRPEQPAARDPRRAHLQRAAALPWTDEGRCAVREASAPWPVLVERCFQALDHDRIAFHDPTGRCAVASIGAAVVGIGVCVLAAPELALGAVVITGVVVVGVALQEAMDAYELRRGGPGEDPLPETWPGPETTPAPVEPSPKDRPTPEPRGPDLPPPGTTNLLDSQRRPECRPSPTRHRGGNGTHDRCADLMPGNNFPGSDVLVNGKNFDAMQLATGTLWDVKTDNFDTQSPRSQNFFVRMKLPELQREDRLARQCGYNFVVGVKSAAHKAVLSRLDPNLKVIVMDWC